MAAAPLLSTAGLAAALCAAAAPAPKPVVTSRLPDWLAPGAPLVVSGFAGPATSGVRPSL